MSPLVSCCVISQYFPKEFMQFIKPNFPLLNGPYSGRENPELLLPAYNSARVKLAAQGCGLAEHST